jgi:hypothetical protein
MDSEGLGTMGDFDIVKRLREKTDDLLKPYPRDEQEAKVTKTLTAELSEENANSAADEIVRYVLDTYGLIDLQDLTTEHKAYDWLKEDFDLWVNNTYSWLFNNEFETLEFTDAQRELVLDYVDAGISKAAVILSRKMRGSSEHARA